MIYQGKDRHGPLCHNGIISTADGWDYSTQCRACRTVCDVHTRFCIDFGHEIDVAETERDLWQRLEPGERCLVMGGAGWW